MQKLDPAFHDEPVSRRWTAEWIGPASGEPESSRALFRRSFEVADPAGAVIFISAEREYELYVNGRFVGRGVPPGPYWYKYYDRHDIGGHLRAGSNTVAVLVSRIGAPLFGLRAEVIGPAGDVFLTSDATWRATTRAGWLGETGAPYNIYNDGYHEVFDQRIHPVGWVEADFDDAAWPAAEVIPVGGRHAAQWQRMVPREIPPLAEWDVPPEAIAYAEEGLDIISRGRQETLSRALSAAGKAVQFARVDNPEALCGDEGRTVLQVSTEHHRDDTFEGLYAPAVVVDFGRVITGYLQIEVDGAAGAHLDVGYVERLLDGHFNNAVEVPYADRYNLADGPQTLTSTNWKGFRYVKLRLTGTEKPVTVKSLKTRISTYDYDQRGGFESSDDLLNGVFDICRYTIRLCSRDFLMDTPWRERAQWLGDNSAVTLPGIYACFGDTALPEQFLRHSASAPLPNGLLVQTSQGYDQLGRFARTPLGSQISDYPLWWIRAVWEHYRYTGDADIVHSLWRHVTGVLRCHWQYLNEFGLVWDLPFWTFIDHVFKPADMRCQAPYNALFYGVLESAAGLAEVVGDDHTAGMIARHREMIAANYAEAFWDADAGLFRDSFDGAAPAGGITEHSNLTPLAYGLASDAQAASVTRHLYEDRDVEFLQAQPFYCVVVLEALRRAGRMDLALQLIRDRWGRRFVQKGYSSTLEEWLPSASWRGPGNSFYGIYRSYSHAWSAAAGEFLVRQLPGFEIIEPGCRKVRLAPAETEFDYTATIPTPLGEITVTRKAGRTDVQAPEGIEIDRAGSAG